MDAPPQLLVDSMGELVERFTAAIAFIPNNDTRDPPGDHHGTGWFAGSANRSLLCSCEHVAVKQDRGTLGYSCYGADYGISVGATFENHPHPIDFACADVSATWRVIPNLAECVPETLLADRHASVPMEYLYFYGFAGTDAKALYGEHQIVGTGVFLHEVDFAPALLDEEPPADPSRHIVMYSNPSAATALRGASNTLPLPDGMSGSALWNTRYVELTACGREWRPEDARVTGIVWGASTKLGLVVATRIEYFKRTILDRISR